MNPQEIQQSQHPAAHEEKNGHRSQHAGPIYPRRRPYRSFGRLPPHDEYGYDRPPYERRPYRMDRAERPYPPYDSARPYGPYREARPPFSHEYPHRRYEKMWPPYYEEYRSRPAWRRRRIFPSEQVPVNVLGLFGLDIKTTENDLLQWLQETLSQDLKFTKAELILDKHSGFSRGFAFIYFTTVEEATRAKEQLTGKLCNGVPVRVEYSITANGHKKEESHEKFNSQQEL